MRRILTLARMAGITALAVGATACGGDDAQDEGRPTIVVTTNVLGDVVSETVGDAARVEVIMPIGADPHTFSASARQATTMEDADLLVVNGAGFEASMDDLIDAVADGGTPVFAVADVVDLLPATGDDHDDETHDDESVDDESVDDHHHDGDADPHLWTDPTRVATAVDALADRVAELDGIDADAVRASAAGYRDTLDALDAEIADIVAAVPPERRLLVTNHRVFAYFADRYGFEVVGSVIPSVTTGGEASARQLEDLAAVIESSGVPAIFAETSGSTALADALADLVGGDVRVVELYTGSLGEPGSGADTYVGMMRTDAELITEALTGSGA